MEFYINSDSQISGSLRRNRAIIYLLEKGLNRFSSWIVRIEVYVTNVRTSENTLQFTKRCLLEARPSGRQMVSANHSAPSIESAVSGACQKMERKLESVQKNIRDTKREIKTSKRLSEDRKFEKYNLSS